jgi:hypothetical protein
VASMREDGRLIGVDPIESRLSGTDDA